MSRVSTNILVILILINSAVGIADASGLSEDVGVELDTGVSESLDNAISTAQDGFAPDSGAGETLFTLFVGAFFFAQAMFQTVFSAPTLFLNLGFPVWFVVPVTAPLYVIAMLDLVYIATGRD
jgi:hypothetical protein